MHSYAAKDASINATKINGEIFCHAEGHIRVTVHQKSTPLEELGN